MHIRGRSLMTSLVFRKILVFCTPWAFCKSMESLKWPKLDILLLSIGENNKYTDRIQKRKLKYKFTKPNTFLQCPKNIFTTKKKAIVQTCKVNVSKAACFDTRPPCCIE